MTKYSPRGYPIPDDYSQPADVPAAVDNLATAIDGDVGAVEDALEIEATRNNAQDSSITANGAAVDAVEARTIAAGPGLTGGGTLGASRTLNVGQGAGILVAANEVQFDFGVGDARYSNIAHGHAAQASFGVGGPWTFQPGQQGGNLVVAHNLGRTPAMVMAIVIDDDGDHSMVTSVTGWDSVNVTCTGRNLGSSAETFRIGVIAI